MPMLEKSYDGDYSIQWQLENYIASHLRDCVHFEIFKAQGIDITETGVLVTDVIVTEASVNIRAHYPLRVRKEGVVENKKEFFTSVPVRLGRIYRLASEIRNYEMSSIFLERNTMNLISIYSRIDSEYLPPMYGGLHFRPCSDIVYWMYNDVKEDMKEVLIANVPYLHVADSDFEPMVIVDPDEDNRKIRQGVYDNMVHKVSDNIYPFINVDFDHLEEMPLDVDFGGFGLLEPNTFEVDMIFSQLCMFEYQFGYNLKYPVLVTLTDSKSNINNREYIFQFPLQVILKDNFPRVRYSDAFGTSDLPTARSECEPKQRLSGDVRVSVVDYSNNGIDSATIMFQCGPSMVYDFDENGSVSGMQTFADRCYMGATNQGVYESRFPQCVGGGLLTVRKEGYVSKTEHIGDTVQDEDKVLSIQLDRVYELDVDVEKLFVKPPGTDGIVLSDGHVVSCNAAESAQGLLDYENAIIRLTKTDSENGELRSPSIAHFKPGNTSTISIAPGDYTVDIMLLRNERFNGEMTLKKHSQSKEIPEGFGTKTIKYPDKDILLPSAFTGGVLFNWTIDVSTLEQTDSISFKIFDEGPPVVIDGVGAPLNHRESCSRLNYNRVQPTLR